MDFGILQALKTVKNNPYIQYVGLGLAALVTQKEQHDPATGVPLRKTKLQMVRISAAVCGIELCYAAETAFVSPILLKLGVPSSLMTLTWCLSPMLGFFLVPVMGSLSDRCQLKFGRRRPFIIIMSIGIILGLGLVPNGESLGLLLGDHGNETVNILAGGHVDAPTDLNQTETNTDWKTNIFFPATTEHFRGILFTILGVAMLDFNCDACQSPCRAYLLDISVPDDHSTGLTTFTVMAGAGGSIGYIMGSIDWNATHFGEALGGHIRVVFSVVLIAFIVCIASTLTSFKEIPLSRMSITNQDLQVSKTKVGNSKYQKFMNEDSPTNENGSSQDKILEKDTKTISYGALAGPADLLPYTARATELHLQSKLATQTERLSDKQVLPVRSASEGIAGKTSNDHFDSHSHLSSPVNDGLILQNGNPVNRFQAHLGKNAMLKNIGDASQTSENPDHFNEDNSRFNVQNNRDFPGILQNEISKSNINETMQCCDTISCNNEETCDEISPYTKYNCNIQSNSMQDGMSPGRQVQVSTDVTLRTYLKSIVRMPRSMWILCLCNLLCWMSLVCYSLYFTDFVGQAVYGGNPQAPVGSDLHNRYDAGVRLGSLGMSLYSLACACYSLNIERLVQRFRAKKVYMLGQLVFTVGMAGMAMSRSKVAVIILSPTAGIMYATLFTMPYLLVAHYHTRGLFCQTDENTGEMMQIRGLGTDVAIISSMVFLAQFLLSLLIGTLVAIMGSPAIVILASCVLSFLGSLAASQVTYLDL